MAHVSRWIFTSFYRDDVVFDEKTDSQQCRFNNYAHRTSLGRKNKLMNLHNYHENNLGHLWLQHASDDVSEWGNDGRHHHLKPKEQMACSLSDSEFSVLRSGVFCIWGYERKADRHPESYWGEWETWTDWKKKLRCLGMFIFLYQI